jgi:hypothetical protein
VNLMSWLTFCYYFKVYLFEIRDSSSRYDLKFTLEYFLVPNTSPGSTPTNLYRFLLISYEFNSIIKFLLGNLVIDKSTVYFLFITAILNWFLPFGFDLSTFKPSVIISKLPIGYTYFILLLGITNISYLAN